MTKQEYLDQLKKYLKRLPKEEYENAMDYFTEYFDEVGDGNVEEAIKELGTPKQAASEILNQMLTKKLDDTSKDKKPTSVWKIIGIALLTICAAPIGLPILLVALMMVFCGIICVGCVLLCGFVGSVGLVLLAAKMLIRGIIAVGVSFSGGCVLVGLGLIGIGASILVAILSIYICIWIAKGIALLARKISTKVRRSNHE